MMRAWRRQRGEAETLLVYLRKHRAGSLDRGNIPRSICRKAVVQARCQSATFCPIAAHKASEWPAVVARMEKNMSG